MPVAIASAPVGTTLVVWFDGKSKIELSPVTVFGVTIVFPSWLIQCACGCPRPMSILRSTDVAPGESSTTDCGPSSPFTATWTSSVSVRVITCDGARADRGSRGQSLARHRCAWRAEDHQAWVDD